MSYPQELVKAHATGNDFVMYIDVDGTQEPTVSEVQFLTDRHRGIGGDGLIRITAPEHVSDISSEQAAQFHEQGAHWFMDYRNQDGSKAQMCGNGARIAALLAMTDERCDGVTDREPMKLATRTGVKTIHYEGDVLDLGAHVLRIDMGPWKMGMAEEYMVTLPNSSYNALGTFVDMGNPHVVCVVREPLTLMGSMTISNMPDVEQLELQRPPRVSPEIEEGQNVEFVRIDSADKVDNLGKATMRVHERGVGETLSCGTGLCATAVVLRHKTGVDNWLIRVPGGTLRVEVSDASVTLIGDAAIVAHVTMNQ